jgi:hypothetical protein
MSRPVRSSAKLNSAPTSVIQFHRENAHVLPIRGSLFDQSCLELPPPQLLNSNLSPLTGVDHGRLGVERGLAAEIDGISHRTW